MIIEARPPVTNLYSSAVFVGWIAVGLGLFYDKIFKNRIGTTLACVIGGCTLIVAHHLSLQGDTMEVLQAVLDSNFWLATHVVTITAGYSAVFLAGIIGIIYTLRGFLLPKFTKDQEKTLMNMLYTSTALALFLSFVGTVLGGIWADQSWGRFWGWDPKENGAILIVLWTSIILHAKLTGKVKNQYLAAMAIFGNIVCSFSWFGVNLLGIGLHSYGFTTSGFFYLISFWISQLVFIIISLIPSTYWTGFKHRH